MYIVFLKNFPQSFPALKERMAERHARTHYVARRYARYACGRSGALRVRVHVAERVCVQARGVWAGVGGCGRAE